MTGGDLESARRMHSDGVAATADGRPRAGARYFTAALQQIHNGSDGPARELTGRILISLANAEAIQGRVERGMELLDDAKPMLPPERRGVLFGQKGLLLARTGRTAEALRELDAAVPLLGSEPAELTRALLNRGLLRLEMAGDLRRADTDLRWCLELAEKGQMARLAAKARHNLGVLSFLRGDLPQALQAYERVAEEYRELASDFLPVLSVDRARALLLAGLFREADAELAMAQERFRRQHLTQELAESELARADAALLADLPIRARETATRARTRFLRRGNLRWAALAALTSLRADFAAGAHPRRLARKAHSLVPSLRVLGLPDDAGAAELIMVRALLGSGLVAAAGHELDTIGPPRNSDRLDVRLLRRLATAEYSVACGHRSAALRQLAAGLDELQRYRSRLGSLDLQTGVAVHGRDLARTGLRIARAHGSAAQVFRWIERARAQALLLPSIRSPEDPDAAAELAELRHVRDALRQAQLGGLSTDEYRARRSILERQVRTRAWFRPGPSSSRTIAPLTDVRDELSDAALVAYFIVDGSLSALVITPTTARVVGLGDISMASEAIFRLRADLDAAAGRALPPRLEKTIAAATDADASEVAALILDPLLSIIGDRDLVVVPTGILMTVPWHLLPGCERRPVTVAPSATAWFAARARRRNTGGILLVAGPGTDHAEPEVRAVAAIRPDARVLIGPEATPQSTMESLNGVAVAHIAAHGHHEPDNALFSSLDLVGGPLMGYDLQTLDQPPALVVLSCCDLGLADVRPGDETLGLTTALLTAGSSTVIASISRVADEQALTTMSAFHGALESGIPPAAALASVDTPGSFVCFGAS